jgi:uncharacterized protein (TIGR03435 family)
MHAPTLRALPLVLLFALLLPTAFAQQAPPPAPLTFEAATIKPYPKNDNTWDLHSTPDGYTGMDISLYKLVQEAYGIYDPKLVTGGPSWIDKDRFDLEAKFDTTQLPLAAKLTYRQRAAMLQSLLADRFHLKVHHETRSFPVFDLVLAKGGPKLQPSEHHHDYGSLHTANDAVENGTTGDIAYDLRSPTGRPVIDRTGLTGRYDYHLHFSSSLSPAPDSNEPSVFTAVEEQLGLKLVPSTAPLDVLVIDSAEKPSAN